MHTHHTTTNKRGFAPGRITLTHLALTAMLLSIFYFSSCQGPGNTKATAPLSATTLYSDTAQTFCINVLSNIAVMFNDSVGIQKRTSDAIDTVLTDPSVIGVIGNWTRIWGPVVDTSLDHFLVGHYVASATMVVVQKNNTDTFIVAIAGTNAASWPSWVEKDFNVLVPLPWNIDPLKKQGHITTGTMVGLKQLEGMAYQTPDNTLDTFLQKLTQNNKKAVICLTGHSLGGAMSPVYALHLKEKIFAANSNVTITCMPVAGATPGDQAFSAYYNSLLQATTYRVWNKLDVVPHGFEPDMLAEVPHMYDTLKINGSVPVSGPSADLRRILPLLEGIGKLDNYYQLYPANIDSFSGVTFNTSFHDTVGCKPSHNVATFEGQAGCQHTQAYATHFGIDSFQVYIQRKFKKEVPFFSEGCGIPPDTMSVGRKAH